MIIRIFVALLLSSLLLDKALASQAEQPGSKNSDGWVDPGWRRTGARYYVRFDEQGLSTTTFDFEYEALDDKGAAAVAQEVFPYNSYFSDMTASDLVTVKADGRVIPVDERAVRDQPRATNSASPYFDERRVKIIAYPNVAAGDRVRGHLTYAAKRPMFPGEFAGFWVQNLDEPPERMELTLDGPASRPVQIAARGVDQSEERIGDRILHHVTFTQDAPQARADETDGFDKGRRFEASTFKDYAAFAAMMNARNAPMAAPDDEMKKLSAQIVGDAATTRAKAERIHNWVAQNIRYVGIGFEDGGWTSQPASATLAARYGDCKAHATLLKALLAAQGIAANLVAVNLSARFTLTQLATPNFDHAIVYVPALDVYLDPTSSLTAFGALPSYLYGKPVLNIDTGVLSTIPVLKPEQFAIEEDAQYTLRPDGTRQVKGTTSGAGVGAALVRGLARYAETTDQAELARQRLEAARLQGSGAYEFGNPRELADSFTMSASFELTQPVGLGAPIRLRLSPLEDSNSSLWNLIAASERGRAFACLSLDYSAKTSLTLPEGTHVYEIPGPLSLDESFAGDAGYGPVSGRVEMSGAVVVDGQTARSQSRVRFTFSAPVCPAGFASKIKDALKKFDGFRMGAVGLTPQPVTHVDESGSDYQQGLAAYRSGNYALAMAKLTPVANQGDAYALDYVARMYFDGRGVPQDYHEAMSWYARAAARGDATAQYDLGRMYANGLGVPQDASRAVELYLKAAGQDYAYAEYNLGFIYDRGQGLAQDYGQALDWYLKAANHGNLEAQTALGVLYEEGKGAPRDYDQAAHWYRQAADRNYAFAQLRLGMLFAAGHGVPLDQSQAIDWYRKAADHGLAAAQFNLGDAYEKGLGVAQDNQQAMEWYRLAVNQGHIGAQSRLDALSGGNRQGADLWSKLSRILSLSSR